MRETRIRICRAAAGLLAGLALLALNGPAAATGLYRCDTDGRILSDRPCGADAIVVPTPARLPQEQTRAAQQAAHHEQVRAERLRAERLERERGIAAPGAPGIRLSPPGLNAAQQLPAAAAASSSAPPQLAAHQRRHSRTRSAMVQRDPRVTFEVKVPAPRRAGSKARGKDAVKPA